MPVSSTYANQGKATAYRLDKDGDVNLSAHFKVREFASPEGTELEKAAGRKANGLLIHPNLVLLLEDLRARFGKPIKINSAYRTVAHNRTLPGAKSNSQHLYGRAADISIPGVAPAEVAAYARRLGVGGVGQYNTFTHVDVWGANRRWNDSSSPVSGAEYGELTDDLEADAQPADFIQAAMTDKPISLGSYELFGSEDEMTEYMSTALDAEHAAEQGLPARPVPIDGELDIGDLRFGASLSNPFAWPGSHNQPTALAQQSAGTVGMVDVIRTDMSPIIGDSRILPEVLVTISLNATVRDDVNKVLRPLVAMQRRIPFTAARNADLARLMLGLGSATPTVEQLASIYPGLNATEVKEILDHINSKDPASVWIPVTIRSITVQSQPGAPDLYQVHVVLRHANILPYVPKLMWWKRTADALQWARYLSVRSTQGVDVSDINEHTKEATVRTTDGVSLSVKPQNLHQQVDDPNQSWVFKKFYRGLLEEHDADRVSNQYKAYPISDKDRLFKVYKPGDDIRLGFVIPQGLTSRDARLAKMVRGFDEQSKYYSLLDSTANLFTAPHVDELRKLGKVGVFNLAFTADLQVIFRSFTNELRRLGRFDREITALVQNSRIPDSIGQIEEYTLDGGKLGKVLVDLDASIPDDAYAKGVLKASVSFMENEAIDFDLPDQTYREIFVPYTQELAALQERVLEAYVKLYHQLHSHSSQALKTPLTAIEATWRGTMTNDAWNRYRLSYEYLNKLIAFLKEFSAPGTATSRFVTQNVNDLIELVEFSFKFTQDMSDVVAAEKQSMMSLMSGDTGSSRSVLNFEQSTIETISLTFSAKFGDQQWDGFVRPVSQHIGGEGAGVTFDVITNDPILLDQLGQLKTAQENLMEIRKGRDVVPALITVNDNNNLLRAFGISEVAYRSHSITMADQRPGYYQIRLDLVQDESVLATYEAVRPVSDRIRDLYRTSIVRPLMIPFAATYTAPGFKEAPATAMGFLEQFYTTPAVWSAPSWNSMVLGETPKDRLDAILANPVARVDVKWIGDSQTAANPNIFSIKATFQDGTERQYLDEDLRLWPATLLMREADSLDPEIKQALGNTLASIYGTTGTRSGIILQWFKTALALVAAEIEITETVGSSEREHIQGDRSNADYIQTVTSFKDVNLSLAIGRMLKGAKVSGSDALVASGLKQQADHLTRALTSNEAIRDVYKEFLASAGPENNLWKPEIESTEPLPTDGGLSAQQVFDYVHIPAEIDDLVKLWETVAKQAPSAYPDLLMREVRDPLLHTNLMGYDFPMGPGQTEFADDTYLTDYRLAESMQMMNQLQLATVGLNVLAQYIDIEAPAAEANNQELADLKGAYDAVVKDIQAGIASHPQIDFPFDSNGNHFASMLSFVEKTNGSLPVNHIPRSQWVDMVRVSETLKLAAYIKEYGTQELIANTVDIAGYATNLDGTPNPIRPEWDKLVQRIRNDQLLITPASLVNAAERLSTITEIEQDSFLTKQRQKVEELYAANEETVAGLLGYTDPTSIVHRAELQHKLKQRWTQWYGMRRAFPTYMLLAAGEVSTGTYTFLRDIYAYSAVSSIEIRSQAESAGQYCDLLVSNMRHRLISELDRQKALVFNSSRPDYDLTLRIKPGTNMFVYLGYGPDMAHLQPYAGRVIEYMPGPVSAIKLGSYATSLNNPPADGTGFFMARKDANRSIAESVLYTLSKTTGLDGLGRGDYGGAQDIFGRQENALAENEYKATVAAKLMRGSGLTRTKAFQDIAGTQGGTLANMVDLVARYGMADLRRTALGDPMLYENIWVAGGANPHYGWTDLFFGGFKDYFSSKKGWGWFAPPGETCWSQLQDQALLFSDYVVTTRPYNVGVPLKDLSQHPLRQTLYFGPKHGYFMNSSYENLVTRQSSQLEGDALEAVNAIVDARLEEAYQEIFVKDLIRTLLISLQQSGDTSGFFASIRDWFSKNIDEITTGFAFWDDALEAGALRDILNNENNDEGFWKSFWHFNLAQRWPSIAQHQMSQNYVANTDNLLRFVEGFQTRFSHLGPDIGEEILEAFKRDLITMAMQGQVAANMGDATALSNPLLAEVRNTLRSHGSRPARTFQPVVEHWSASVYTNVIKNEIRASGGSQGMDQDFANRIQLQFPKDPDDRANAYMGLPGSQYTYVIQANPGLHPDHIVEKTIFYPNLRSVLHEEAALLGSQLSPDFSRLVKLREELRERESDTVRFDVNALTIEQNTVAETIQGQAPTHAAIQTSTAAGLVEQRLFQIMNDQGGLIKPKFQVVAANILRQSMGYMYNGSVTMAGEPRLYPYHIMHLYDDVKQMHGPVEVAGVYHSFDSNGFYTVAQPRLVTGLRASEPMMDTLWMNYATMYGQWMGGLKLLADSVISGSTAALVSTMTIKLSRWVAGLGFKIASPIGWGLALGEIGYTINDVLGGAGEEKIERFVGTMATITDMNPLYILPLTYRQQAMVAGLTGATGPSTMTSVLINDLNESQTGTDVMSVISTAKRLLEVNLSSD